jgi:hypothetical protein
VIRIRVSMSAASRCHSPGGRRVSRFGGEHPHFHPHAGHPHPDLTSETRSAVVVALLLWWHIRTGGRVRLPGELHSSHEHADAQAQDQQVEQHTAIGAARPR